MYSALLMLKSSGPAVAHTQERSMILKAFPWLFDPDCMLLDPTVHPTLVGFFLLFLRKEPRLSNSNEKNLQPTKATNIILHSQCFPGTYLSSPSPLRKQEHSFGSGYCLPDSHPSWFPRVLPSGTVRVSPQVCHNPHPPSNSTWY